MARDHDRRILLPVRDVACCRAILHRTANSMNQRVVSREGCRLFCRYWSVRPFIRLQHPREHRLAMQVEIHCRARIRMGPAEQLWWPRPLKPLALKASSPLSARLLTRQSYPRVSRYYCIARLRERPASHPRLPHCFDTAATPNWLLQRQLSRRPELQFRPTFPSSTYSSSARKASECMHEIQSGRLELASIGKNLKLPDITGRNPE